MNKKSSVLQGIVNLFLALLLIAGLGASPLHSTQAYQGAQQSVIVQSGSAQQAADLVQKYGGQVTSQLEIIHGVGALVPADALPALRAEPAVQVTGNASADLSEYNFDHKAPVKPATDYPDVTGADVVNQQGDLGKGVTVAIVDTGISFHPDLLMDTRGKMRAPVIGWVDFVDGRKFPIDPNGHGTHIAGIIANAAKGEDGEFNGMAPGVNLVGVRVLDKNGAGDYEKVIKGIQWVVDHKDRLHIRVMNLSLHSLVQSPYWADPLNQAVMRAWAAGITVVVASGNDGPNPMSISVPGNVPYVLTVGAFTDNYTPQTWDDDYIAPFSAAGPTLDGFVKPDLVAPGAHIVSTMLPGSYIARNHDANWVKGLYFSMAGTSQAAAVASGAAALVIAQHPELTPDQVKYRLMATALPWVNQEGNDTLYSVWQQGAGRLNAYDAVYGEEISGAANNGLDLQADLDGSQHFEGYSYFDAASGKFYLHGAEDMTTKFGSWAGDYGTWSGKFGSWAGGFGSWAGGFGSWAGGFGSWAGGFGSWAGGFGSWAGGFGSWAGGFGSWAGGFGSWAGGFGSWAGQLTDPTFIDHYINGVSPDVHTTTSSIPWVEEH